VTAARLWTITELADYLGQDYDTIARKSRLGLIPTELIRTASGRRPRRRFDPAKISAMLAGEWTPAAVRSRR
jgi:hypothetical protein